MSNIKLVTFPYLGETHSAEKVDQIKVLAAIVSDTNIVFPTYEDPTKFQYKYEKNIQLQFLATIKDLVTNDEGEEEEQYTDKLVQYETLDEYQLESRTQVLDSFESFDYLNKMSTKRTRNFINNLKTVTLMTTKQAQSMGYNIGNDVSPDNDPNRGLSNFSLTSNQPTERVVFTDNDKDKLEKAKRGVVKRFNRNGVVEKTLTIPEFLKEFEIDKESRDLILKKIKYSLVEFFD